MYIASYSLPKTMLADQQPECGKSNSFRYRIFMTSLQLAAGGNVEMSKRDASGICLTVVYHNYSTSLDDIR